MKRKLQILAWLYHEAMAVILFERWRDPDVWGVHELKAAGLRGRLFYSWWLKK